MLYHRRALAGRLALAGALVAVGSPALRAVELTEEDFRQVGQQGFGDRANSYVWSAAFFRGKLYIGSNRNFACLVRSVSGIGSSGRSPEIPIECEPSLLDTDLRGRIFAYDPETGEIEPVYVSPTVKTLLSDGSSADVARDAGYRTMIVFREPDGTEALYVGTFSAGDGHGRLPRVLRSVDGRHFTEIPGAVVNNSMYRSFRALTVYKDRLYVLAIGPGGDSSGPALLEASDPASEGFRVVSEPGFGDPVNLAGFELAVFKGYLYVGTGTVSEGFQLLKTQAAGQPPYVFQKVLIKGAFRGAKNQNVVSLYPFKGYLYLGTGINFAALNLFPDISVATAELLRVKADDTWEIVSGEARETPEGFKESLGHRRSGLGNALTGYFWRMVEHDGVLYVGTFDNAVIAQYSNDLDLQAFQERVEVDLSSEVADLIARADPDELGDIISAVEGGFDLWSTTDGLQWTLVSRTGLGDQFSYGVRTFISMPWGLYLGTANPFFGFRLYLGQPSGTDTDGDGHSDPQDNCPLTWNLSQADFDADGIGDHCDKDSDNDCIPDDEDPEPRLPPTDPMDSDRDGQPDRCDLDDDNDGVLDVQDNCPSTPNLDQTDEDGDGLGDACQGVRTGPDDRGESEAPAEPGDADAIDTADNQTEPAGESAIRPSTAIPQPCGAGTLMVLYAGFLGGLVMRFHTRRTRSMFWKRCDARIDDPVLLGRADPESQSVESSFCAAVAGDAKTRQEKR